MRDRFLFRASLVVIAGVLLSGPVAVALVAWRAPQPPWSDVETFARHHHALQELPYAFGFVLLGGLVALLSRAAVLMRARDATRAAIALVATAIFATVVFVNYTLQLAWLPHAARARSAFVELIAMTNPQSICWSFEMFAYAIVAIALVLVAPVFEKKTTRALVVANVVASVGAAAVAAGDPTWLMTTLGLVLYAGWNALLVAIMVFVAVETRERSISGRMWG